MVFFDSIQQSVWAMNDQIKLGNVGFELAHTTDKDRIKELTDEMERLQGNFTTISQGGCI